MRRTTTSALLAVLAVVVASACGSGASTSAPESSAPGTSTTRSPRGGTLTVLAASSLTKAFTAFGARFEAANAGTVVQFSFGSSSQLATQIGQGAPADVFASADHKNMQTVVDAGDAVGTPTDFARNTLTIAVAPGNPKHIATLADLTRPGTIVVLCDTTAPCGKFADQVLTNAKVAVAPRSRELTAKATLAKVELGEADAAIVYVSDVASSTKVTGVPIPAAVNVTTTLPIVRLRGAADAALADRFIAFVVQHRTELVDTYGFLAL